MSHSVSVAGKCISIQGTVVRVSNIKPLVTSMAFRCSLCQDVQAVALPDGKYTLPNKVSSQKENPEGTLEELQTSLGDLLHQWISFTACNMMDLLLICSLE